MKQKCTRKLKTAILSSMVALTVTIGSTGLPKGLSQPLISAYAEEQAAEMYSVTVNGGKLSTGKTSGTVQVSKLVTVKAYSPANGEKFSHWERNGVMVSSNTVYSFYMPSYDIDLEAVFVDDAAAVTPSGNAIIESIVPNVAGKKVAFTAVLNVPKNCTYVKGGIVATNKASIGENVDVSNAVFVKLSTKGTSRTKNLKYTWTRGGMTEKTVWYVKGYLVYKDSAGVEQTVYSDCVAANINGELPLDVYNNRVAVPRGLRYTGCVYSNNGFDNNSIGVNSAKTFTPVVLGLNEFREEPYSIYNGGEWYSPLFWVNGSLNNKTRMVLHYLDPTYKTVINGDFDMGGDFHVSLDYDESELQYNFSQKDVPYIYVNGKLSGRNIHIGTDSYNEPKAPFNVFVGSIDVNEGDGVIAGDLYLMDEEGESQLIPVARINVNKWIYEMQTTNEQFVSGGGNIYCNHDLTLGSAIVEGDVRVRGKLTLDLSRGGECRINGDIVCDTLEIIGDCNRLILGEKVYCDDPAIQLYSYYDHDKILSLSNYQEPVYPSTMTREAILGSTDLNTVEYIAAPQTKLIVDRKELLEEVGYDLNRDEYVNFYTDLPNGVPVQTPDNTFDQYWENGTTNVVYIPSNANLSGDIEITPTCDDFWIVIGDGGLTSPQMHFNLIIDDSIFNVNILIRGELRLDCSSIISKRIYDRLNYTGRYIDQNTDKININIYSTIDSQLSLINDSFITGNAMTPYMDISCMNNGVTFNEIITKHNETISDLKVNWIGNGIFRNSFEFLPSLVQVDPREQAEPVNS